MTPDPAYNASERRAGSPLILLVDRDANARQTCAAHLRRVMYKIDEADDGREALAKAISHRPSVIVTTGRLAGISGFELCRLLRNDPLTRDISIVIVTANAFASEVTLAEAAGADAVLAAPCSPERLALEIGRLLTASTATAGAARVKPREQSHDVAEHSRSSGRRPTLSRAYERRDTTQPPAPPPSLICLMCDRPLRYLRSHIGGVSERHAEQWDYFECADCRSMFEYRQRTRKMRSVSR